MKSDYKLKNLGNYCAKIQIHVLVLWRLHDHEKEKAKLTYELNGQRDGSTNICLASFCYTLTSGIPGVSRIMVIYKD